MSIQFGEISETLDIDEVFQYEKIVKSLKYYIIRYILLNVE